MASDDAIRSVERTLDLLEQLSRERPATLSSIASDVELPKSTVHRHLRTLERRGYLVSSDEGYRLGLRLLGLGERARDQYSAYRLAAEKVRTLATETTERAQFIVEEHGRSVYVHEQLGADAVKADTYPGKRVPIHASAAGLAILAAYSPERVERIVERNGLEALTAWTITDGETLNEELARTRERGYSINDQGVIEGLRAIGVSVTDSDGSVLGALSVSGPIHRMSDDTIGEELSPLLLGEANELELNIAYR
jgi:DNA-binding IclR family transcriptional regulator